MFSYYLKLSLLNLKRAPTLYLLVVMTLAIGVGVFTANLALLKTMANDPIPEKSSVLFHVSMNTWPATTSSDKTLDVTRYRDAMAILDSGIATTGSTSYRSQAFTRDANSPSLTRYLGEVRAATPSFLSMMDAPIQYGSGFTEDNANEVVIGHAFNQTLFNGENSVGKTLEVNGVLMTVVGVLAEWDLRPMFYHVHEGLEFMGTEDLFVPLETALDNNFYAKIRTTSTDNWSTMAETREKSAYYLQTWVELDTPEQKQKLQAFMDNYAQQLKDANQLPSDINNLLHDVNEWLEFKEVVDSRILAFAIATSLFLIVCLFNASSLLLARYNATNFETALKRALGAGKKQIIHQGLVEGTLAGSIAGLASLILSYGFLHISIYLIPDLEQLARFDISMLALGFFTALATTLLSAMYPVFRASRFGISTSLKG